MVTRKISVFLIVIAFHLVIMGIVYYVTEETKTTDKTEVPKNNTGNKKNDDPVPPDESNNSNNDTDNTSNGNGNNNSNNNSGNKPGYIFHTVAKGEFLSKIAEKYKVSPQEIMTVNNIKDQNKILLGQKLKIPVK